MHAYFLLFLYEGSKDHIVVQGEILEGLVARIVSHESSKHIENVLKEFPLPTSIEGIQASLLWCKNVLAVST